MPVTTDQVHCGIVALLGPPNAGKSTLLNTLLGQKIAIVTPKPQTTRNRILGVVNGSDHQIILLDTPGLHKARTLLNREMVKIATETAGEVDVLLFMIDATRPIPDNPETAPTIYLSGNERPAILLLNKIDLLARERLLPIIEFYQQLYPFRAIMPISALAKEGIEELLQALLPLLPTGPRLYPEDIPTDASERFIVAEIIREKVFLATSQEIPYSTAVLVDRFKEEANGKLVTIDATICVEKKSQKGIIIGKQGAMLRKIGSRARKDIQHLLASRVYLKLWVKVQKDWTKDQRFLKELGL